MLIWTIIIALALLLQTTVFSWFDFYGAKPDLILITVIFASFRKGALRGAMVGFWGGLAEDLASGGLLGINAFVKVLTGYILGSVRRKFDYRNKLFQSISVLIVSGLTQIMFFSLSQLCGQETGFDYMGRIFVPFAVLNGAAAPFIFRALEGIVKYDRSKPD